MTNKLFKDGIRDVGKLTKRDLFVAGVALYWAEGFKHKDESGLGLGTSDPNMAKFYVFWLERCLGVSKIDLIFRVTVSESHKDRIFEIERFWIMELRVGREKFAKSFYQKKNGKKYI